MRSERDQREKTRGKIGESRSERIDAPWTVARILRDMRSLKETLSRRIRNIHARLRVYIQCDVRVAINHGTIVPDDRSRARREFGLVAGRDDDRGEARELDLPGRHITDTLCETTVPTHPVGVSTGITGRPSERRKYSRFHRDGAYRSKSSA